MRRTSATYKLISLLAIIFIMAGTTGFVVSSHTCISCGVHEASVSLFGASAGDSHICTPAEGQMSSCCSKASDQELTACCTAPPEDSSSNNHGTNGNCNTIGEEPCCQYETSVVIIDTINSEKSRIAIQLPDTDILIVNNISPVSSEPIAAVTSLPDKQGASTADIRHLICCYRL